MTEVIKDDIAPGPKRRKTERAVRDQAGNPVALLYDEENDRTVMSRGDITGGMRTTLYVLDHDTGEYNPVSGGLQNGVYKLYVNQDDIVTTLTSVLEELRILNMHLTQVTDMQITKDDIGV